MNERLSGLEGKLSTVENRVATLEENEIMKCSKEDLQNAVTSLQVDLIEMRQRSMRHNNRVVFGIEENEKGILLLENLLAILLPGDRAKVDFERIGKQRDDKHRPIRLYLANGFVTRRLCSNLSKLKGLEEFSKVSVDKDLTKQEQEVKKSKGPYFTRSEAQKVLAEKKAADLNSKSTENSLEARGQDDDMEGE